MISCPFLIFESKCCKGQFISKRIKGLQILLDPLGGGHPVLLLEGGVEDGLAFESRAGCDARWKPRVKKQLAR